VILSFTIAVTYCKIIGPVLCIGQLEQARLAKDEDRRATWLETRNLEENFKQLVYLSMQEVERFL